MTTTLATERQTIGELLAANWNDCLIAGPNEDFSAFSVGAEGQRQLPSPTSQPANPARFLIVEFDYLSSEQITFDGDVETRGLVRITACVERGVGDRKLRQMVDTLAALFRNSTLADTDGIQFLELEPGTPGVLEMDGDWYGFPVSIPFVRFKEATVS